MQAKLHQLRVHAPIQHMLKLDPKLLSMFRTATLSHRSFWPTHSELRQASRAHSSMVRCVMPLASKTSTAPRCLPSFRYVWTSSLFSNNNASVTHAHQRNQSLSTCTPSILALPLGSVMLCHHLSDLTQPPSGALPPPVQRRTVSHMRSENGTHTPSPRI